MILEEYGRPPGSVIEVAADDSRAVFRDLSDPSFGPTTKYPVDLGVEADGSLLVLDEAAGTPDFLPGGGTFFATGALLDVAPDGTRFVLSDFGDPSQGATFSLVQRLALLPDRDACRDPRLARARVVAEQGPIPPQRRLRPRKLSIDARGWCAESAGGRRRLATRR